MDWYQGMDGDLSNFGYLVISGYRLWWYGLVWRYDWGFGYFGVFGYFRLLDRLVLIGMGLWLGIRVFWGIWLFPVIGKKNKNNLSVLGQSILGYLGISGYWIGWY